MAGDDGLAYTEPDMTEREDQQTSAALRRHVPSLFSKLSFASYIYGIKGILAPMLWIRQWKEYFYPPGGQPNIIKKYECRLDLPIR